MSVTTGLLYQPRMVDECGAVGGISGSWNQSTRRKLAPVLLCPLQIPHDPGSNPGHRVGKPATNRLSYGTATTFRSHLGKACAMVDLWTEPWATPSPNLWAGSRSGHRVPSFTAVWSSTYWVLGTKYDVYAVLWGCLLNADETTQRKFASYCLLVTSWTWILLSLNVHHIGNKTLY
jgi:hypothetical protein